jgi:hypothetical protein
MRRSAPMLLALAIGAVACGTSPDQRLREAAASGDRAGIRASLQAGANVDAKDPAGETPLMLAVRAGQEAVIEDLLAAGANRAAANNAGEQPTLIAVQQMRLAALEELQSSRQGGPGTVSARGRAASFVRTFQRLTPVISEVRAVTPNPGGVTSSGRVAFRTQEGELRVNISTRRKYDSTGGEPYDGVRGLYFPGLRHEFSGRTVVPLSPTDVLRAEPRLVVSFGFNVGDEPLVRERTKTGWVIKGGEAGQADEWALTLKPNAQSMVVEVADGGKLILDVAPDGYRYVDGVATVRLTAGKEYVFPAPGFTAWRAAQAKPPEPKATSPKP